MRKASRKEICSVKQMPASDTYFFGGSSVLCVVNFQMGKSLLAFRQGCGLQWCLGCDVNGILTRAELMYSWIWAHQTILHARVLNSVSALSLDVATRLAVT